MDLSTLNPPQRDAVLHREGPVLVLAGAGSGKTRVITTRIAHLIAEGVRPEHILGVTFTNKAAKEMRERVARIVPPEAAKRVLLGTFHSLGAQILRRDIERLGYFKQFTILDETDKRRIIRDILKEARLASTGGTEKRVLGIISRAKNARRTPASLPEAKFDPNMPRAQRVYDQYQAALKALNAVDFDDLLLLPTRLLDEHTDVREHYRRGFRYVMVDEFQDTNPIQLALLQGLVGPPHNIMAVGDDDQSIYAFRGAVADNILHFDRFFPNPRTIALEQNYRSVGTILDAANAVIAHNTHRHPKALWSAFGAGGKLIEVARGSDVDEADYIARRILKQATVQKRPLDHFAVLYRSNGQTRVLEEAFRQHNVPYKILGGNSVFDRKEVKDLLSYLRLLLNPRDEMAIRRVVNVPTRGVGTKTIAQWDTVAREREQRLADTLRSALRDGAITGRPADGLRGFFAAIDHARSRLAGATPTDLPLIVRELLTTIQFEGYLRANEHSPKVADVRWRITLDVVERLGQSEATSAHDALETYVQQITLDTSTQHEDGRDVEPKVVFSTLHSSKGLEFPIVFMCGMCQGTLPHDNALKEGSAGLSEERRLCYVGMTRAKESLILTRPQFVMLRNQRIPREPSMFLEEIPATLLHQSHSDENARAAAERAASAEPELARIRELLGD